MKPVAFTAEAADELEDAAAWYRSQRAELGDELMAEVDRILPLIGDTPASFSRLLDLPSDLEIRRARLRRFPYAVVFVELDTEVRILAVAHAKRRPGYWLDRVVPR